MLLVDDRERERLVDDVVLDDRVRADQQVDLARGKTGEDVLPLLALLAAGEDRNAQAGALGERRDRLQMLARENFGRRHQRGLLARFGNGGSRQQRDHRLAGADVALQQPQHAKRFCEILGDRGGGLLLRGGQRIGQGIDDLPAQMAVARVADARGAAKLRPHQRQRQLAGKQLVEGEPLPEGFVGKDVVELLRNVDAFQRFVRTREISSA